MQLLTGFPLGTLSRPALGIVSGIHAFCRICSNPSHSRECHFTHWPSCSAFCLVCVSLQILYLWMPTEQKSISLLTLYPVFPFRDPH